MSASLPDKAIDVIDEAGASVRLEPAATRTSVVDVPQIENVIAKMARIPPKNVRHPTATSCAIWSGT